nr:MAG TPA: hypothetical protein [Caudoviricetes sp.]DAT49906.1 MAG TPA: hypothetical protein [Caudoviricetes sp.]DAU18768.1 MAG TPA: hypothetical protein [Caudoviricetes sp.]
MNTYSQHIYITNLIPLTLIRGFLLFHGHPKAPACVSVFGCNHSLAPTVSILFTEYPHKGLPSGTIAKPSCKC